MPNKQWWSENSETEKVPCLTSSGLHWRVGFGLWALELLEPRPRPRPRWVGPGPRKAPIPAVEYTHGAAVHAAVREAGAQHAAADLHRVVAAAGLLAEEAHGGLLQLPRHGACRRHGPVGPRGARAGGFPDAPGPLTPEVAGI